MADNITCNVCGGTNFHKESGFYYCNECQTQSQDIQERVFAIEDEDVAQPIAKVRSSRKIRAAKKVEDRLTSWECYNYILRGLVEELIQLGADVNLKKTVQILWLRYLNKLEVTTSANELPKLGAVNSKIDAEIIYGRSAKRKRTSKRSISPVSSEQASSSTVSRRERSNTKRKLALAEYDEYSATLQSEDISLHNQSLTSIKSSEDSSKEREKHLQFNKYARKELLKHITENHLKDHIKDIDSNRTCHKASHRSFSTQYVQGPAVLTRSKIYAVLYLGLLINKDNVQLGDLIRFVREGHLSYHNVNHFFPEDLDEKKLNIQTWNEKHSLLTHFSIRQTTAQVAHFIDVTSDVPIQNLLNLCRRYCSELNLPDEVWAYSINLLARTSPKMKFTQTSTSIPNYEGRVLSIILFVLKLLLGLDDKTEKHFSNFAREINESTQENMFVWNDWIYHINYRKLLLSQYHFPTNYLINKSIQNTDISTNFLNNNNAKIETELKLNREAEVIKNLLEKFRDQHCELHCELTLAPSLRPFRSYAEALTDSEAKRPVFLTDVLTQNFTNDSFKFLINPLQYFHNLDNYCKVSLKHRGANNIKVIKLKNLKTQRALWRRHAIKEIFVNVTSRALKNEGKAMQKYLSNIEDAVVERNSESILKNFKECNKSAFNKHRSKLIRSFKKNHNQSTEITEDILLSNRSRSIVSNSQKVPGKKTTNLHYIPFQRYYLKNINVNSITNNEFLKFFQTFPKSFQDVMNECTRITEQEIKVFYEEFTNVEVYLCYVAKFSILDKYRHNVVNPELKVLINRATMTW